MLMFASLALATIGAAIPATYFSPWIAKSFRIRDLRKRLARERVVSLTYDDGPSASVTPRVLDLLHSYNVKATFFLLGRNVRQHHRVVDRLVAAGHDVGCHSDQHLNAWLVTPWQAVTDIDSGYERLSPWVRPDGMFRPPYGKMTLATYVSVRRRSAPVWWWTIDAGDTFDELPRPREVVERLAAAGGGIVLMHDSDRSKERNEFVLETSALVLDWAKRESLSVKLLRELCR